MVTAKTLPKDDYAAALRLRERKLERYSELERSLVSPDDPAQAIAGIGWLYDLLPEASRERPVDPSGIIELHRCLAVLDSSRTS